jgi:uncharacterized membrane protein YfcA
VCSMGMTEKIPLTPEWLQFDKGINMLFELSLAGLFTGVISGFFGIGGGTVLVPVLIFMGFVIKDAIGISILQMAMSSIYGSYINSKSGLIDLKLILPIGIGGFIGATLSIFLVSRVSNQFLEILFLFFLFYAFYRVIRGKKSLDDGGEFIQPPNYILALIGSVIGFFAISIGVGGSLLLVPILVGFFHYDIKKAIATGLFFVIFSSVAGAISFSLAGKILYYEGLIVGFASLLGVKIGIELGKMSSHDLQKNLLLSFYSIVAIYMSLRIFAVISI